MVPDRTAVVHPGRTPVQGPTLAELQALRQLRALGFTQAQAAAELGWHKSRVFRWWRA